MLITERRLRRLIRRTLLEDNNNGPPLAEVKAVLESLKSDAQERFKSDNRRFIRSLARGLSPLNIFKRRAVIKALRNFDVVINVVDRLDRGGRNVLGFYKLSRDQQFYNSILKLSEEFQERAGESQEEVNVAIQQLEDRFEVESLPETPYGEITLSTEAISKKYSRFWDDDDPQKSKFRDAVLTDIFYEEITHFIDFFAVTTINDILGSRPFSVEGAGAEWIIKVDKERIGAVSDMAVTIQDLRSANILESEFDSADNSTELIRRKLDNVYGGLSSQGIAAIKDDIDYISDPAEMTMGLSILKREYGNRIAHFFDEPPMISGILEDAKTRALYVILDPAKRNNLTRYLRKFRETRAPS